jgi:hypothetical protein
MAFVNDDALIYFARCLSAHCQELTKLYAKIAAGIESDQHVLREYEQQAQRRVTAAQDALEQARADLDDCESQEDEDYLPDCSDLEHEMVSCEAELSQREHDEDAINHEAIFVDQAIAEWDSVNASLWQTLEDALVRCIELLQGSYLVLRQLPLLPAKTSSVETFPYSHIGSLERGIIAVPLSAIDDSDSPVRGPNDFAKIDYLQMKAGVRTFFAEIWPNVLKGAKRDFFENLDKDRKLEGPQRFSNLYDVFFGLSAIRLEKHGDKYSVINGYHRLFLARELGITEIPASVVEIQ